jgi:hypothetical protein
MYDDRRRLSRIRESPLSAIYECADEFAREFWLARAVYEVSG